MSRSEPLFAVCAVDQVPTWAFDKLLSARDSDWRDRRRQAGKGITTTPNGYTSDGVPLNEETDPEHFWDLCVARALTSDDDVSVTVPPVGHFLSPFLNMSPEEVAGALRQKAADSRVLSDKIFVIVDLRSAIDDTMLVCERQDEDEDKMSSILH